MLLVEEDQRAVLALAGDWAGDLVSVVTPLVKQFLKRDQLTLRVVCEVCRAGEVQVRDGDIGGRRLDRRTIIAVTLGRMILPTQ